MSERSTTPAIIGQSSTQVHPTAVVDPRAELSSGVVIGPGAIVGPEVRIGSDSWIGPHVVLDGRLSIGARNRVFPGACIGLEPQDLKYRGAPTEVVIGADNTIREYVTINRATDEGEQTRIGDQNLLMAYCHLGHNCELGDGIVIRSRDGDHAPALLNGDELTFGQLGDFLPDGGGRAHRSTLNGVDDEVFLDRHFANGGILDVILIIHVRRGITNEEHDLQNLATLAPGHFLDGFMQSLVYGLGSVATTLRLKLHELAVDLVDVIGQVVSLRDVFIAAITIAYQAKFDIWGRLG